MTESLGPPPDVVNLVTWNILLDKTRARLKIIKPQHERIESQAKTLMELGIDLDVIVLQEAQGENGQRIAELTGNDPGFWEQYNRTDEHIGVFGRKVESAEFHELSSGRKVVVTRIGNLAVFGVHFSARPKRCAIRAKEAWELRKLVGKEEKAVILGDLNGLHWEPARILLGRTGLSSAFTEAGLELPPTYPTEAYRHIMWTPRQQQLTLHKQVSIDDIMVRGADVIEAESFMGDSDHFGLRAAIQA